MIRGAVAEEPVDPGGLSSRGPANAEARIHAFQSAGGDIVKLIIGCLFRIAGPEIEVRLIPYLEIPLRDFVDAIPLDQVASELRDQIAPAIPVLGRGYDRRIPKSLDRLLRSQLFGHEAQLDKWANAVFEQAIVDLIDVGKVVDGMAGGILVVDADFIMEDRVEADVFKTSRLLHLPQILAITIPQTQDGPT